MTAGTQTQRVFASWIYRVIPAESAGVVMQLVYRHKLKILQEPKQEIHHGGQSFPISPSADCKIAPAPHIFMWQN